MIIRIRSIMIIKVIINVIIKASIRIRDVAAKKILMLSWL